MKINSESPQLIVILLLFLFGSYSLVESREKAKQEMLEVFTHSTPSAFDSLRLQARAAYVYDLKERKVLFEMNASSTLPLASLTKVMLIATAADYISPDTLITVTKENLKLEGDSGLYANERWTFRDLADVTLTTSSNDAARAIASSVVAYLSPDINGYSSDNFIALMNGKAQKLDLTEMYFLNETGLDTGGVNGAYGSAESFSRLLAYLIATRPELLEATRYSEYSLLSESNKRHTFKNTNTLAAALPGILASKTGFTEVAGGNLAIVFDLDIGHPVIVTVLGSTLDGRFSDVRALVSATRAYHLER